MSMWRGTKSGYASNTANNLWHDPHTGRHWIEEEQQQQQQDSGGA